MNDNAKLILINENIEYNEAVDREEVLLLIKTITALICDAKIEDKLNSVDSSILETEEFKKLYKTILDLRTLTIALSKGELDKLIYSKGYTLANLKALQSNLRHLTWQTKKIAEGDFSQKVDFLGDFSDSFNKMTDKLRENSSHLIKLANIDMLTQIPNRRSLIEFLEDKFFNDQNLSVFIIDIDDFKSVNDTYGHDVGDDVLVHISQILNQQFRGTDFISRYGGEEFVAVLPDTTFEIANKIAIRLLKVVEQTPVFTKDKKQQINLTISIGISCKKQEDISYNDILKRSDKALYAAKNSGKNKYCFE